MKILSDPDSVRQRHAKLIVSNQIPMVYARYVTCVLIQDLRGEQDNKLWLIYCDKGTSPFLRENPFGAATQLIKLHISIPDVALCGQWQLTEYWRPCPFHVPITFLEPKGENRILILKCPKGEVFVPESILSYL